MMWGVLATYGNVSIISVEMLVCLKTTGSFQVFDLQLTGILAYLCNRVCIVVRPFNKIHTPCSILYRFYDFTLQ